MAIDLNVNPYYDDFDEFKNFHQLLFKPGYSVQARELTQIQSILQNQISKFGKHIFKQGSVVIPGNTYSELRVSYVKVESLFGGLAVDPTDFSGGILTGLTSNVKAKVKTYVDTDGVDPLTFYLIYTSGGGENATSDTFVAGETLVLESNPTKRMIVVASNPVGYGTIASIREGVYFVNGKFVSVASQSVVMSKYDTAPSCSVLLKIGESIVTQNEDSTLLDPAQGSFNFAAPGSDRLKVSLTLVSLPLGSNISDDYIELMRYNQGILELHSRYPQYSELERSLARRTYDESGNYIVNGFTTTIREHLNTGYNNGLYKAENPENPGDESKFVVEVLPGKAYINGLELERISGTTIEVNKARTTQSSTFSFKNEYGRYIYVSGLVRLPNFTIREQVTIYNTQPGGTAIGTLRVIGIDYHDGNPSSDNAIYKLYIDELNLTGANTLSMAGRLEFSSLGAGSAIVVHKIIIPSATNSFTADEIINATGSSRSSKIRYHDRPRGIAYVYNHTTTPVVKGDYIVGASSSAAATITGIESSAGSIAASIFELPKNYIKTTGVGLSYDTAYTTWKTLSIPLDGSGVGDATITDGTFVNPEVGTIVAIASSGTTKVIPIGVISLTSPTNLAIASPDNANATVIVCAQVRKSGVATSGQPKTKTLTEVTLSDVTPQEVISLGKTDIYELVSIVSGGEDVTSSYVLDNGQQDLYYGIGFLTLIRNLPTSNLTITFKYFEHSSSGDYFSADSYKNLTPGSDLYISLIPEYVSRISSKRYFLGNCLDFRPTVNASNNFNGSTAEASVVDTFITTSASYYIPRIDILYLDQNGSVKIKSGIASSDPLQPSIPSNSIALQAFFVDAYTESTKSVFVKSFNNYRYTMSDIKKLDKRIKDLEYYTQLNSVESSILSYKIIDAETGIDKFKSGYIVDNFTDHNLVCDYYNRENRCSFWNNNLTAPTEDYEGNITFVGGTNFKNTNGIITLNYNEVKFIEQPVSSKVENLNPFLVINWSGTMTITPSSDIWIETQDLPTVVSTTSSVRNITRQNNLVFETRGGIRSAISNTWETLSDTTSVTNVPAPPVGNLVTLTAYAGVLGLISDPSDPKWFYVVRFTVPQNIADQNLPALRFSGYGGSQTTSDWASVIAASNNAFNSAVTTNLSSLGISGNSRISTELINNNFASVIDGASAGDTGAWK